jgi:hypothetical protein
MPDQDITLTLLPEPLAVCRLNASRPIPEWILESGFFSVTRTPEELSLVCPERLLPRGASAGSRVQRGFKAFRVEGPLAFYLSGVLSGLLEPLARERIPVFVLSTYDTDYILVRGKQTERAIRALKKEVRVRRGRARSAGSRKSIPPPRSGRR